MGLTREQLLEMNELQLQKEILRPLFERMGYQDVHIHQGPTEAGKDLVMWKLGDFGQRVNYAVVAKAKPISGSASGSSGAGTVATQIQQCFGKNYLDHVTAGEERVNHVYVVCSQEISQVAIDAIKSALGTSVIERCVDFIDAGKLWMFIQQYLSERVLLDKLGEIGKTLDNLNPNWRVVGNISGEDVKLSLEPKTPAAVVDEPLQITGHFRIPNTPEGKAKKEEFERAMKTGSTVTMTAEYLDRIDMPDFLVPLMGEPDKTKWQLTIGSAPASNVLVAKITMSCADGEQAVLEYIPLIPIRGGDEEITFSNEYQKVPWRITVVFNRTDHTSVFHYKIESLGMNVKRILDAVKFNHAIAKGGILTVEHLDSGLTLNQMKVASGMVETPPKFLFDILERLVFIQQKTGTLIHVPPEDLLFGAAEMVRETAHKIEHGEMTLDEISFSVPKEAARKLIEEIKSGKPMRFEKELEEEGALLFGANISLGPAIVSCESISMTPQALTDLIQTVNGAEEDTNVPVVFTSSEEYPIRVSYPKWLPQSDAVNPLQ